MGEFALGKFWTIFGPLVAFVIIGINLFFAYDIIIGFESVSAYVISGVIAVLYFGKPSLYSFVFSIFSFLLLYDLAVFPSSVSSPSTFSILRKR